MQSGYDLCLKLTDSQLEYCTTKTKNQSSKLGLTGFKMWHKDCIRCPKEDKGFESNNLVPMPLYLIEPIWPDLAAIGK